MSAPLVVGYDGTAGARAALAEAVRLAGPLDAELVCAFARHVGPTGSEVQDLAAAVAERGRAVLDEAMEAAEGVTARAELIEGRPSDALTVLAEREGAQMIIVGSNGEAPLRGILLGSTPYRLLHQCPLPVLVVRGAVD
jgi:nucleotide-binding universal stress UspA family protein